MENKILAQNFYRTSASKLYIFIYLSVSIFLCSCNVSKGKASYVKELVLNELSKIDIDLNSINMNFQIVETMDISTLYWHFRVEYLE